MKIHLSGRCGHGFEGGCDRQQLNEQRDERQTHRPILGACVFTAVILLMGIQQVPEALPEGHAETWTPRNVLPASTAISDVDLSRDSGIAMHALE